MNEKENENKFPLIGDKFPEIEVQTTFGTKSLPNDYKDKWLVLFSHPGDFTPVCTTEFYSFAKRKKEFDEINTELIGLSMDQVFSHIKWAEWIEDNLDQEINFPIIADHGKVANKLGMLHPNTGTNTVRAVFIIDPRGIIRLIMYYPQEIGRSVDEIIRSLKALQYSDKHKVAMPENWPNNLLFKNKVIIPPAKDVETAKKRKEEYKDSCYDWWLCYKNME
ncbi:MAG: peroxiredoxin [archaeon]|jgi:peroxiredoxin (alkyl hydroperoxide reductase subunit C)|nr:peroxiredoxin [archaeon]MDD2477463.1 peroxiredoxin [Candidatus ainarchaeum sp.]MDD3084746.1 peroxiredoxin [Candidatus ainarchaeum sp.]MDD4220995.1 peroxiredoxin [Candidatus ainarchaeum sp.]MDD4662433.1 peroxiredoxin [Candidatus ainarchaeum sp.]